MTMTTQIDRARGFSLVEIMVAMVIGLVAMIVIFQVFAVFEGQKRTTTGAGDAQQNGLLALFAIERDARMSGYGINYAPWLGCNVAAYDAGPPVRDPFNFILSPAQIVDNANNAPDTITLVYGDSSKMTASVPLLQPSTAGSNKFTVANGFGWAVGDNVIVGETGVGCSLATITSIPTPQSLDLFHDSGTYTNPVTNATQNARYNKNGGLAAGYNLWSTVSASGGRMLDIGPSPVVVTYSIQNSQLMAANLMQSGTAVALVDGIVQLQAQYGKDYNGDGIVDQLTEWDTVQPASAADWAKVLAMRIVVVSRSAEPERRTDAEGKQTVGACNATTVAPTASITIDLTADPNWQCYRYRVFETVVPLRNQIWAPK
jgi:type IV pilus assembly protein PilW